MSKKKSTKRRPTPRKPAIETPEVIIMPASEAAPELAAYVEYAEGIHIIANENNLSEAELTASELLIATQLDPQPITVTEVTMSELVKAIVIDKWNVLRTAIKQQYLRAVAVGNEALGVVDKWVTKHMDNVYSWAIKADAKWKDYLASRASRRQADNSAIELALSGLSNKIDNLNSVAASAEHEAIMSELRRISKRLNAVEAALHKNNRAINRVDSAAGRADPEQLKAFTTAMLQGRKTNATNLYRELTGASLAEAKAAIESM